MSVDRVVCWRKLLELVKADVNADVASGSVFLHVAGHVETG